MQQHIAQLLTDVGVIVLHECITKFIGLFNGVWPQALVGLLTVPRTFNAQLIKNIQQTSEGLQLFFTCIHINIKNIPISFSGGA